ncbi:MAG: LLM class flavin-dependent oxidoreductase [Deltaproteobacteria bacterium]|nr:MAG: LLM class flavin-dependent oxidoreductase [Deltaproteobacteria bacterium]
MRIGVYLSTRPPQPLERMIEQARRLEQRGLELLWIGQLYEYEALALAALLGRETQRIALGTWVVPTYPRHPGVLAQQALTAQAASRNRLVLGIGLSHQVVIEKRLGLDFSRPVRHMREYLAVLLPLLRGEPVAHDGQLFRVRLSLNVPGAEAPQVLVGALGPQMLRLCARVADGVAIWLGGAEYLERFALAHLREASAAAGRPFPRIAVGLPIAVCRDRPRTGPSSRAAARRRPRTSRSWATRPRCAGSSRAWRRSGCRTSTPGACPSPRSPTRSSAPTRCSPSKEADSRVGRRAARRRRAKAGARARARVSRSAVIPAARRAAG